MHITQERYYKPTVFDSADLTNNSNWHVPKPAIQCKTYKPFLNKNGRVYYIYNSSTKHVPRIHSYICKKEHIFKSYFGRFIDRYLHRRVTVSYQAFTHSFCIFVKFNRHQPFPVTKMQYSIKPKLLRRIY